LGRISNAWGKTSVKPVILTDAVREKIDFMAFCSKAVVYRKHLE
jgi:hypothetical protein